MLLFRSGQEEPRKKGEIWSSPDSSSRLEDVGEELLTMRDRIGSEVFISLPPGGPGPSSQSPDSSKELGGGKGGGRRRNTVPQQTQQVRVASLS